MADDPKKKAEDAKKSLKDIGEIVGALDEGFRDLTSRLTDVVDEIKNGSDELTAFNNITKDINRSIRSISRVNEDLVKNQILLNNKKLSSKNIEDQINKITATREVLNSRLSSLQKKITEEGANQEKYQEEILKLQSALKEVSEEVKGEFEKQLEAARGLEKSQENINKSLGVAGNLLKGAGKLLDKMGLGALNNVVDFKLITAELEKQAAILTNNGEKVLGFGGKLRLAASGATLLGGQLLKAFTDPTIVIGFLINAFKRVDKGVGDLAKGFNMTYNDALKTRQELTQIASLSGDAAVNTRGLQESMMAIGQTLGSNAKLNKEDLVVMTQLRERAGFTNDELSEMERLTLATGGNLDKNVKNLLFSAKTTGITNKVLLNEKEIMRDVAKASDAVKLSLSGNPEALGRAAAQAKALGMNLNQVDSIADSLLDFESSINNELTAQLITGKDINLDQARLYALNNDMEGLSREIAKNAGTAAQFGRMGRVEQESLAKAFGMSRNEVAKMLIDREALQKMSIKDPELAKKTLEFARQKGMTDEQISKLKEKDFDNLMKQQSVQDKFNQAMEKLQDIIGNLVNGPFGLFLEGLSKGLDYVGKIFGMFGKIGSTIKGFFGDKIGGFLGDIASVVTIGALIALVTRSMLKGTIFNPMIVKDVSAAGGGGGLFGGGGGGGFSGGIGRIGKAFKYGGAAGAGKAASRILSKTLKGNALTALLMGGIEAGSNLAEGKGVGESLGRAALSGLFSLGGGALGSLIAPGVGTVGGGIAGGMLGDKVADMLFGEKPPVDDAMISPSGGLVVAGAKGAFSLNKDDTVIAGTNLNKKSTTSASSEKVDISPLIDEIKALRQEVARQASKPTIIENSMNGTRFGTATAMNTYKTQ